MSQNQKTFINNQIPSYRHKVTLGENPMSHSMGDDCICK